MNIFTISIIAAFIGIILIGVAVSRTVDNKSDYFLAGRNAGVLVIVGTLVASYLSTVSMMGEAGLGYEGFPWAMLLLACVANLGYIVGVVLFGRYLRASRALTIPEYFAQRFNSPRLRLLSGLMVVIGVGLYLVAVTRGISMVLQEITGINGFISILITWAGFTLFTVLSGSKGVLITDTVMFFVFMVGGTLGFLAIIYAAGGFQEVFTSLSSDSYLREGLMWHGTVGEGETFADPLETLMYFVSFGLVWMFVVAVSPWQASRYMMAKSTHTAVRAGLISLVVVVIFYVLMLFAAYAVNLTNPNIDPAENVLIWASQNIMPLGIGVIVVVAIMAAGLSSASTFLSLVGFSATNDIVPWIRRKEAYDESSRQGLLESRITMVIVGFAALAVTAVASPTVLQIGYMAAAFFAASWGFVAFGSTQSKRMTERGAFYGMLLGGSSVLLLEGLQTFAGITLPGLLDPVLVGLLLSAAGIVVGSATTRPTKQSIDYINQLKALAETGHEASKEGITVSEEDMQSRNKNDESFGLRRDPVMTDVKTLKQNTNMAELATTKRYMIASIVILACTVGLVGAFYIPGMLGSL